MPSIFVSYRRTDSPGQAGRLLDSLRAAFGKDEIFMDVSSIAGGSEFSGTIKNAIRNAKVFLAVIGPNWNNNDQLAHSKDWIRQEVTLASELKRYVIPVLVNGASLPEKVARRRGVSRASRSPIRKSPSSSPIPADLHRRLFGRNYVVLRDERWDSDIEQVIAPIKLILSPELRTQKLGRHSPIRVLVYHDLPATDSDAAWQGRCTKLITDSVNRWYRSPRPVKVQLVSCAEVFEGGLRPQVAEMYSQLLFEDSGVPRSSPDFSALKSVAQSERHVRAARLTSRWLLDNHSRRDASTRLKDTLATFKPALVLASGVAALAAYDVFADLQTQSRNRTLVTLGAPFALWPVRSAFGGRITGLPRMRHWIDLINPKDSPFGKPLSVDAANFAQIDVPFERVPADAQAFEEYLNHETTRNQVWSLLAPQGSHLQKSAFASPGNLLYLLGSPRRRAFLVGINDYPDPEHRLRGCINDVYLMSSCLQEMGYDSDDIAVMTDERATSACVRERLHWLLDSTGARHERLFYFSGHGVTLPTPGATDFHEETSEALVTYDFNWSMESSIHDHTLAELYAQLPYNASFTIILDCGFPQGAVAQFGSRGTRGLNPPDDIQHALLTWNRREQGWEDRPRWTPPLKIVETEREMATYPLGLAVHLRQGLGMRFQQAVQDEKLRRKFGHLGPYHPNIIHACRPDQLCMEYRHGTSWSGAFTYALATSLRQLEFQGRVPVKWEQVIPRVNYVLRTLRCEQSPLLWLPQSLTKSRSRHS